ncbi:hypothetical protein [Kurthia sibirica]|uniref:Uncharacterized protein n=1 Tax=Kurthia sibirica TaxID=202750 RepID=A0A2U3ADZ8_9BACL|nr:hypothetical protein [Kurthia sibirica]PWI22747.1 hypothetical protein DEX24_16695 [Kurthia sibirica]GEK35672.1 hypothetical protein KSI01_32050 [Kurthia sibirica]
MPTNKLTIVPVTLDPITDEYLPSSSLQSPSSPSCMIKTANAEISFFNGVDERIIQTIMKELNKQ